MSEALVLRNHLPLDRQPARVYLGRLAAGSRRTMREALERLAGILTGERYPAAAIDWSAVGYQHAAALRARLADSYSVASVNKHLSALRGVLREAWKLGQMNAEQYHRAVDVKGLRGTTLPQGRALAADEMTRLFQACDDASASGIRDAAAISILYGAGLRRSEVAALSLGDYDPATGCLTVRQAKGRKDRTAFLGSSFRRRLDRWLQARGGLPGPLLCRVTRGGSIQMKGIGEQAIYNALRRRLDRAGIDGCSPHDLRRTFVSDLLDRGADVGTVRDLAGHAHVQTTLRYDRRGESRKQKAAELLSA